MTTDLFAAVAGLPPGVLAEAVPPACRPGIDPAPRPEREGDDLVVTLPPWRPRVRARHLLPALSAPSLGARAFRFELAVLADGAWSPWVATTTIGTPALPPLAGDARGLRADVDEIVADAPSDAVRLRVRIGGGNDAWAHEAPWLVTLSASDGPPRGEASPPPAERPDDGARPRDDAAGDARAVSLAVPARSQMEAAEPLRRRICSPTSVAMVLDYWRAGAGDRPVSLAALAAEMLHPGLDLYGVWPAAIHAAARRGVLGYLLRFPGWDAARWLLARGVPIVASVRYGAGELAGAAIDDTEGHLLVLTGFADDDVLVNDPAAPTAAEVPRRYRGAELRRAWLARGGVGYVLFRPA